MLSTYRLEKAVRNPSTAIQYLWNEGWEHIRRCTPHEVGVQGSYETGNIGDRALGEQFKIQFQQEGYQTRLFHKSTSSSNAQIRVLGGGGVLHDWYGTNHLKNRLDYLKNGEKKLIIGVGAPGFQSEEARSLVSQVLNKVDVITVRDEWSRNNIENVCDANVAVTACPAFLYKDPEVESSGHTGVNFRPYFGEKEDMPSTALKEYFGYEDVKNATEAYIKNAQRICQNIKNPVFIPFAPKDEEFAAKHLDIPQYDYEFSVETTLERISGVEQMVATRYHSLIFAAICGKPVLPLAYEPKVEEIAKRLDVPYYKPHKEIPIEFAEVSNIRKVRSASQENFERAFRVL